MKADKVTELEKKRIRTSGIVKQLNRVLVNSLGPDYRHLYEVDTDIDPRQEAFWYLGGINPPDKVRIMRSKIKWLRPYAQDSVLRYAQYVRY